MRRCVATLLRAMAAAFVVSALVTAGTSSPAAAACPSPSDTKPATVTDLEVTTPCDVKKGTYYYGNVNITSGGVLNFFDETIDFWAKAIIVEADGSLIAGALPPDPKSPCANAAKRPIGCAGGVVTIHLYGEGPKNPKDPVAGAPCKSPDKRCGVPFDWSDDPTSQVKLPPKDTPITDYFYKYGHLPFDGADDTAFFGTKVLGVGYGGTLKLFGAKGATYCKNGAVQCPEEIPSSDSGTSWRRLAVNLPAKDTDKKLTVDRAVDWGTNDRVVVTTTDYLPGHSEVLQITGGSGTQFTYVKVNESTGLPTADGVTWAHNGQSYPLNAAGIDRLKLEIKDTDGKPNAETRAAVALLTRSIRIVSGGDKHGDDFPAEPPPGSRTAGYYFGGHTIVRQGFQDYQVQGVEFFQLGQGGRLGHYPVHFHIARTTSADKTKPRAFVKDSSIHDSMTRWIVLHGTHNVLLERNVGYQSIGHGFYLEDGTEIENQLHSNLGVLARAAIQNDDATKPDKSDATANPHNPRKVPGILAAEFQPPPPWDPDNIPFYTDFDHPTVFWIMNGWNDFEGNMAVGAGTCGACYWLVTGANSGHSLHQKWDSYAALQAALAATPDKVLDRAGSTPLKKFVRNYCSSAMNSFNTISNATQCHGVFNVPGFRDPPALIPVPNPLAPKPCIQRNGPEFPALNCNNPANKEADDYYPKVDQGGGRFATRCDDPAKCASLSRCDAGAPENCMVTVLDHYTSSFHWAAHNFAAIWLRPQWYLMVNSVLSDVQNGGLTFVTGGGYTASDVIPGHWALARKSAFIGTTQPGNPLAADTGPVNKDTSLRCDQVNVNHCLLKNEAVSLPLSNFANNQRLFNIYDGPAYQDANAYLSVFTASIPDCKPSEDQHAPDHQCRSTSIYPVAWTNGLPQNDHQQCYMPNAAIAWKQPNGFFYPPAFHSANLFFDKVDIRHFVIEPEFTTGTYESNVDRIRGLYCTWDKTLFNGFTDIDRQTELSDDDGSLTGLVNTISVNLDPFFNAPVETIECASDVTAKTSPYDYVTTVMYPGCAAEGGQGCPSVCVGANCFAFISGPGSDCTKAVGVGEACNCGGQCIGVWRSDCATPSCYGVPMYRQFTTWSETTDGQGPGIRMAGQDTSQRSTLTVNHGKYYIDTAVDRATQLKWIAPPEAVGLNVFEKDKVYYVFDVFAKPTTKQTYQLYVGSGFDKTKDVWATTASVAKRPIKFDEVKPLPAGWEVKYGTDDGLPGGVLQVTMDMGFPAFKTAYDGSFKEHCKPATFCEWNTTKPNQCGCSTKLQASDPALYAECAKDDHRICSVWAVRDVDCPDGKCYGFGVKLGAGFDYAQGQAVRKDAKLKAVPFPQNDDWNVAFHEASAALAGVCALKPVGISNFYGQANNVGSTGKGYLTLKGSFTPPASFHLADAQTITLNLLLHDGDKELVSGFGTNARPLPLSLVRRSNPANTWDATFVTGKAPDGKTNISPVSQLDIKADGGRYKFQLNVGTGPVGDISIAEPHGCPRRKPDVELVTAFNVYGGVEPIDVGVKGEWDCTDDKQYNGHN